MKLGFMPCEALGSLYASTDFTVAERCLTWRVRDESRGQQEPFTCPWDGSAVKTGLISAAAWKGNEGWLPLIDTLTPGRQGIGVTTYTYRHPTNRSLVNHRARTNRAV